MKNHQNSTSKLWPALIAAAFAAISGTANAEDLLVPLDHVRTVILQRPAKTVYIGNPTVADITVVDARHIFVLGKAFGSTNLVALDAAGEETANEQVVVTDRTGSNVTVQRGIERMSMVCTSSYCEAAPTPGDDAIPEKKQNVAQPSHDGVMDQVEKREGLGDKAAQSQSKQ